MTQTAQLGDKTVNRIGYGAMQLAGPGVFGPPRDPDAARAVLKRAIELGVDHIDTSQYYGPNVVNELIHEALHPYPESLKLVTKVGGARDDQGGWLPALGPGQLRAGLEENLATLEIDKLDAVNLRLFDPTDADGKLAEWLGELEDARKDGLVDLIGVSNVTLDTVKRALELVPVACVQNAYSVVNRGDDDLVDFTREHGIAFVPFFPLGSAFAGGPKSLAADPAIAPVAEKHGVPASQIALAWLLRHSDNILLIPGTSSVAHLEQNLSVADITLDDEDLASLDNATQLGDPTPSHD